MKRQTRRIEKAIDELIKIQDDGHGTGDIANVLDQLNSIKNELQTKGVNHGIQ